MCTRLGMRLLSAVDRKNSGFTLIELLVVLMIGGMLAAIALPSFLNRANAAKQAEAKTFLGNLNRAQQAFYTEHNHFSDSISALTITTGNSHYYNYSITVNNTGQASATHQATPLIPKVRAYIGMSAIVQDNIGNLGIQTVVCEADDPTANPVTAPMQTATSVGCAPGSRPLE